jgi:hypothetical protein
MTHQPRYRGTEEDTDADVRAPLTTRQRWQRVLVIAIVIGLLLVMVILHLTGTLGKGMNG